MISYYIETIFKKSNLKRSNIYDGSAFTADMAVQNFIGDGVRGATWVGYLNRKTILNNT